MKKQHGIAVIVVAVIVLVIFIVVNLNKKAAAKKKAAAAAEAENSDYNFHKNANPSSLLDDATLGRYVKNLIDAYEVHWYTIALNTDVSQLSQVAHSVNNQAQWSQVLDVYAQQTGEDLIENVKKLTNYVVPFFQGDNFTDNIKPILDYIKTLPSA